MGVWLYFGLRFFSWFSGDGEKIVKYTIDVPNPPGDGTIMETPSIKVRSPDDGGCSSTLTFGSLMVLPLYNVMLLRLASSWAS